MKNVATTWELVARFDANIKPYKSLGTHLNDKVILNYDLIQNIRTFFTDNKLHFARAVNNQAARFNVIECQRMETTAKR